MLPPALHRVGALLSTAEGKPTVLHRLLVGALAGYMVLHFSGGSFLPAIYYLRLADALQNHVAFVGGPTFAGITALNSLRQVTRRGGFLVQLGADSVLLPRAAVEQLEGAQRRLKYGGSVMVVMMLCFFEWLGVLARGAIFLVWIAIAFGSVFTWWYTLKVAATLTAAPVARVSRDACAEAKRMRENGAPMDPERWRSLVEEPVLLLECDVLPVLSKGWGTSGMLVGSGLVLFALACFSGPARRGMLSHPSTALLVIVFFGPVYWLPFSLSWDPADASSKCARLEGDINALCGRDSSFAPGMRFLRHVKALNNDQGLGFVIGGQVVTKRTLKILATGVYSGIAVFGPTIMREVGLAGSCAGGAQHAVCKFGWTFADDACFKKFGDPVLGQRLGWVDAEEACQELGDAIHLASVTSAEQEHVVQHLAPSESVWIGLNDFVEEGSYVWSDDEPFQPDLYENWQAGQPESTAVGNGDGVLKGTDDTWYDFDETVARSYICGKSATPVAASGGETNGCTNGRWVMGTPYKQVASLSYLNLPPTIVYGAFKQKVYHQITPTKISLNETVTTPAECATLVRRDHRTATAAAYSNVGKEWCTAVFEA